MSHDSSAWKKAEAFGIDMRLIRENLEKTPTERVLTHARLPEMALAFLCIE